MKKLFFVFAILVAIFSHASAHADLYTIQSLYQSIRGDNHLYMEEDGTYILMNESFFHESLSSPVYMHDSITGGQASLSSSFDENKFSANLFTGFDLQGRGPDGYNGCYAELNLVFAPTMVSQWQFVTYSGYAIILKDLTTDILLFKSSSHSWSLTFILDPSHNYELHMKSDGYDDDARNSAYIFGTVTAVPESATILLLSSGLMGLVGAMIWINKWLRIGNLFY